MSWRCTTRVRGSTIGACAAARSSATVAGPRREAQTRLDADFAAEQGGRRVRTLAGVRIEARRGHLWFAPEVGRATAVRLEPGGRVRLGGRDFCLSAQAPRAVELRPLGAEGRRGLVAAGRITAATFGTPTPSAALIEGLTAVVVDDAPGLPAGLAGDGTAGVAAGDFRLAGASPVTNSS